MTALYVYAVLGQAPAGGLGVGIHGERVRVVPCGGLFVAAGAMDEAPPVDAASLRGHDVTVRRLAEVVDAILPARFGSLVADEESLARLLEALGPALREALALVAGCEQMTLRVYGPPRPAPAPAAPAGEDALGPGARYLMERKRAHAARETVPEIEPIRADLAAFVHAERVERHDAGALRASVYHLIPRGRSAPYVAALRTAARRLTDVRVSESGPWAPYAFAPEAVP